MVNFGLNRRVLTPKMLPEHILFSDQPAKDLRAFLDRKAYSQIAVLTDDNTVQLCYPIIKKELPAHVTITIPAGEELKTITTCVAIWEEMTEHKLDRHALVIVLGGGVLGDMGGFCASTYKRGIDFMLIPTTLLAMADASIGGKLGVDFQHYKNHIGVFREPVLTLLAPVFLKSLPKPEMLSGFAEIIKHTLISDAPLFESISPNGLNQDWDALVRHSVKFKYGVTEQDPHEAGLRKILNTGHTIGHAVETYLLKTDKKVMHGEAVAMGILTEAFIAEKKGMITAIEFEKIKKFIGSNYTRLFLAETAIDDIIKLAQQDKKNRENRILCVLLDGIGKAKWDCEITPVEIQEALEYYRTNQT